MAWLIFFAAIGFLLGGFSAAPWVIIIAFMLAVITEILQS